MDNFVAQEKKRLQNELEKINEQLGLLTRYEELAVGATGAVPVPVPVVAAPKAAPKPKAEKTETKTTEETKTDAPKKRGRPKGSKNKPKEAATGIANGDGKPIDLPTLLETIGQQVNKPLVLADFVTLVRESGYTTKAKDFPNMVYQALHKLVKRGSFSKNEETRAYEFVQKAA